MSTTNSRRTSFWTPLGLAVFAIILIVALFAVSGCATPAASTADPAASSASTPEEEPSQTPPAPLYYEFGGTATAADGISLSVSVPAPYTPSGDYIVVPEGTQALVFEFVVTNNSSETFDPTMVYATLNSAGKAAEGIFDTANEIGFPPQTSLLPGQTVKWKQAFGATDPASLTMDVEVGIMYDPFIFTNTQ